MSSPSVLFVLHHLLESGDVRPGRLGLMVAFGAGFSAYAALLEFV
jgi:predicted naringenin-chalcone synthase